MNGLWLVLIVGLGLPVYAFLGYPVLLFVFAAVVQVARDVSYLTCRRDRRVDSPAVPGVSVIIAAHNEEGVIRRCLTHALDLDYPADSLEILLGSDGSTDGTVEAAESVSDSRVRLIAFTSRRGKLAVIKDCVSRARGEILVFTDANTALAPDAVRNLLRHFGNPMVGAVCGELHLLAPDGTSVEEGLYWRYEKVLKVLESRLNAVLGANGAIYAVRHSLFPSIPEGTITEDFVIPMSVRARGYRVVYDPEAAATEEAPAQLSGEFRRRVRIGAGNWHALGQCWRLLLPWKGFVALSFWSHKVLRWFTPFLLAAALGVAVALAREPAGRVALAVQGVAYGAAALGFALRRLRLPAGPLGLAAYFVTINAAIGVGMIRGLLGLQRASWPPTARGPIPTGGKR